MEANKKQEDVTAGERDSTVLALEMKALELTANPLFGGREAKDTVEEIPEGDLVKVVKTHPEYIRMASNLKEINKSLQSAKEESKHSAIKGKAGSFKMIVMKGREDLGGVS